MAVGPLCMHVLAFLVSRVCGFRFHAPWSPTRSYYAHSVGCGRFVDIKWPTGSYRLTFNLQQQGVLGQPTQLYVCTMHCMLCACTSLILDGARTSFF